MRYIYCYINKTNGHKYVGQTNNLERRKREHISNAYNKNSCEYNVLFHKKIREYGIENFDFIILENVDNDKESNDREIFWIEANESYCGWNKGGYNMTIGGELIPNEIKYSKEIIKKVKSEIKKGTPYKKIKELYEISEGYISGINNGIYHSDNNERYPLYKYYNSQEEINYIIKLLIETNLTMKDIAKITNKSYSTIKKINYGKLRYNKELKYPLRKVSAPIQKAKKVQELLIKGYSTKEIMQLIDVSKSTVDRINKGETNYDCTLSYPLRKACIDYLGSSSE